MSADPLLLGHRGARTVRSIAENSIASFDLALEHGCHGIEFDLRLTRCGRAVVCHNSKVGKVAVSRVTSRHLRHLPCLEDVLRHYNHRVFLDIELKVKGLESTVLGAIRERARHGSCVVSSFLPEVVMDVKARSGVVPVGLICSSVRQLMRWREMPCDYVMVQYALLTHRLVRLIQGTGRKVFAWTVNDSAGMIRLANWGVNGLISDETRLLAQTLG